MAENREIGSNDGDGRSTVVQLPRGFFLAAHSLVVAVRSHHRRPDNPTPIRMETREMYRAGYGSERAGSRQDSARPYSSRLSNHPSFCFGFIEHGSVALEHPRKPHDWLMHGDVKLTNEDMRTLPMIDNVNLIFTNLRHDPGSTGDDAWSVLPSLARTKRKCFPSQSPHTA